MKSTQHSVYYDSIENMEEKNIFYYSKKNPSSLANGFDKVSLNEIERLQV